MIGDYSISMRRLFFVIFDILQMVSIIVEMVHMRTFFLLLQHTVEILPPMTHCTRTPHPFFLTYRATFQSQSSAIRVLEALSVAACTPTGAAVSSPSTDVIGTAFVSSPHADMRG